jgi:hypothetical protein
MHEELKYCIYAALISRDYVYNVLPCNRATAYTISTSTYVARCATIATEIMQNWNTETQRLLTLLHVWQATLCNV